MVPEVSAITVFGLVGSRGIKDREEGVQREGGEEVTYSLREAEGENDKLCEREVEV